MGYMVEGPKADPCLSNIFTFLDSSFFTPNLHLIRQKEGNTFQVLTPTNRLKIGRVLGGGAVRSFDRAKKWLYLYPEAELWLWTRFVNQSFISFCSPLQSNNWLLGPVLVGSFRFSGLSKTVVFATRHCCWSLGLALETTHMRRLLSKKQTK